MLLTVLLWIAPLILWIVLLSRLLRPLRASWIIKAAFVTSCGATWLVSPLWARLMMVSAAQGWILYIADRNNRADRARMTGFELLRREASRVKAAP